MGTVAGIIDIGLGNIDSVRRALTFMGFANQLCAKIDDLEKHAGRELAFTELGVEKLYPVSAEASIGINDLIEEILDIGLHHKIKIPASFVLFGKTIVTLEGVALEYDPNFRLAETSRPFIEKLIMKRTNPLYVWKNLMHNMNRYRKFAEDFPEKAERALDRIQRGTIKVDIEDTDIRKLSLEIDRSSNRVAYGLLIAALLITTAILINVEKGPSVFGIPVLAFLSFFFASVLLFILFISIVREKLRHF